MSRMTERGRHKETRVTGNYCDNVEDMIPLQTQHGLPSQGHHE